MNTDSETPIKLLMVVPALSTVYGGPSLTTIGLASALGGLGVSVDVITTNADGQNNLDVVLDQWIPKLGYRLRYFPRLGRWEYKFSFAMLRWLNLHLREYDIVHGTSVFNFPILATALACRLSGVPFVVNPQGMLEPWALAYKAWKKRIYYSCIERPLVLRGAHLIQALNGREAVNIASLALRVQIDIIPNGTNSESSKGNGAHADLFFDRFPGTRGKKNILFLHRVDPKKGLDLLAVAYAMVRKSFPQTHLIVAGPDTDDFGATARGFFEQVGYGHSDAVTFTGMLDGDLKRGALAAANVFVAPSYSEGFSMSVLEAMAAGIPCVITTGCNFPEAGEASAARITAIGAKEFAAGLSELLADPAAAQKMGERARRFVLENYTWDQIAALCEQSFRRVAATPH